MRTRRTTLIIVILTLLMSISCAKAAQAQEPVPPGPGIWQSASSYRLRASARHRLLASLKRITGVEDVAFQADGRLDVGVRSGGQEGSSTAHAILRDALASGDVFVLEDHSRSPTVNFGQIEGMDYINDATHRHARVWWIRLDFDDFLEMTAPPRVRASFDEGVTLLHELLHALGNRDPTEAGELGACETILNQVRAEIGLPLRIEYFAKPIHGMVPGVVLTRLRFRDGPAGRWYRREHDLLSALSVRAPATAFVRQRRP